jgi:hypothetical protein
MVQRLLLLLLLLLLGVGLLALHSWVLLLVPCRFEHVLQPGIHTSKPCRGGSLLLGLRRRSR